RLFMFVTMTCAPVMAAPLVSLTVPAIVAPSDWPDISNVRDNKPRKKIDANFMLPRNTRLRNTGLNFHSVPRIDTNVVHHHASRKDRGPVWIARQVSTDRQVQNDEKGMIKHPASAGG